MNLEFWFEFASPYTYIAAMRIEDACREADVPLRWKPFLLGPIFELQGWNDSHYNLNPRRGAYMWRDMERLTAKLGLAWHKPSVFPRATTLAARIACANETAPWCGEFVRRTFVANFGEDRDISGPLQLVSILKDIGLDGDAVIADATAPERRDLLRANTASAIGLGIFGAPNFVVGTELYWGEEAMEDALEFARSHAISARV